MLADDLKPADVGLNPELPYFRTTPAHRTPAITYLHLYECEKFSVSKLVLSVNIWEVTSLKNVSYMSVKSFSQGFEPIADGDILFATVRGPSAS